MKVKGYTLPLVQYPNLPLTIHPHQAVMLDEWNSRDAFLLVTKTGSGKTAAATLPFVLNRDVSGDNCAVFVYPTNELIRDQARSILELLRDRLHLNVREITPDEPDDTVGDEEILLVRADADLLTKYCEGWKLKRKADALERLLLPYKAKIVLTNPDTLYLLYSLKYGRRATNILATLQAYQTIVFDEFHLYQGVELAHVLYLIHAARKFGSFKRVVLLSATPHAEVRQWIDRLLKPREITMEVISPHPQVNQRQVAHEVSLAPLSAHRDPVNAAFTKIQELAQRLRQLRAGNAKTDYVPAVVILNSVVKAIELEDQLRATGFAQDEIVPIRGMSDRKIRQLRPEQLIVVGTSAIEVGIDFHCDYLLFEAGDAASFMQRFGRLGRHQPGTAFVIGTERECRVLESQTETVERGDLEEVVAQSYPQADARAWFVGTELGAFAALSQAFSVRERIWKDRDRGPGAEGTKQGIYEKLKQDMLEYGEQLGIEPQVKQAHRLFWTCKRGAGQKWVDDYLSIDSFRTSLPSEVVHDRAEEKRRGSKFARYQMDIASILERAANPQQKGNVIYIDNINERHKVKIAQSFGNMLDKIGCLLTTADYSNVMLTRDGQLDSVSSVMSRREKKHTFVFVPKEDVIDELDWRMEWFYCRDYKNVLAFDGDALLLKEIWKRVSLLRGSR